MFLQDDPTVDFRQKRLAFGGDSLVACGQNRAGLCNRLFLQPLPLRWSETADILVQAMVNSCLLSPRRPASSMICVAFAPCAFCRIPRFTRRRKTIRRLVASPDRLNEIAGRILGGTPILALQQPIDDFDPLLDLIDGVLRRQFGRHKRTDAAFTQLCADFSPRFFYDGRRALPCCFGK